jgi:hypothetical protein
LVTQQDAASLSNYPLPLFLSCQTNHRRKSKPNDKARRGQHFLRRRYNFIWQTRGKDTLFAMFFAIEIAGREKEFLRHCARGEAIHLLEWTWGDAYD